MYRKKIFVFILLLFIFNLFLYSTAQAAASIELTGEYETETSLDLTFMGELPAEDSYSFTYNGNYWYGQIDMFYSGPGPNKWDVYIEFIHEFNPHPDEMYFADFVRGSGTLYNDDLDIISFEDSSTHGLNGHYDEAFFNVSRDDTSGWTDIGVNIQHVSPPVVPEPVSSTLFLIGGATLGFRCFRKKRKTI